MSDDRVNNGAPVGLYVGAVEGPVGLGVGAGTGCATNAVGLSVGPLEGPVGMSVGNGAEELCDRATCSSDRQSAAQNTSRRHVVAPTTNFHGTGITFWVFL